MERANSLAAIAITTAGVLLALASVHGSVFCSIADILEGQASAKNSCSRLNACLDDDDEDSTAAFWLSECRWRKEQQLLLLFMERGCLQIWSYLV
jgi:hypothetical protein